MDEKLQEILRRQQESEYLKKQNITSRHQLQKLRSQAPGEYFSHILNQCIHMNRHTGTYHFLFILSNASGRYNGDEYIIDEEKSGWDFILHTAKIP